MSKEFTEIQQAIKKLEEKMDADSKRSKELETQGNHLEAQKLYDETRKDLESLRDYIVKIQDLIKARIN